MNVRIISNAATPRARRHVAALRDALPDSATLKHHVTDDAAQLAVLLGHDRWHPDDLVVINGGDGSVQHALSLLADCCPAPRWPRLACLPGGSTNMTAFDLNTHRGYRDCLRTLTALLRSRAPLPEAPRPVVRVCQETGHGAPAGAGKVRCGLFFGIGTIVQGVEYFHARLRGPGGRHELAAGAALARALWGIARRQPPFAEPLRARIDAPGLAAGAAPLALRLLLATTLDRLFLGIRPYWGDGPGPLKATLVEARARGFVRHMPRLLRGRPDGRMTPADGYHSARVGALDLTFNGSYTLDGELFPCADDRIAVRATHPVRFVPL